MSVGLRTDVLHTSVTSPRFHASPCNRGPKSRGGTEGNKVEREGTREDKREGRKGIKGSQGGRGEKREGSGERRDGRGQGRKGEDDRMERKRG